MPLAMGANSSFLDRLYKKIDKNGHKHDVHCNYIVVKHLIQEPESLPGGGGV